MMLHFFSYCSRASSGADMSSLDQIDEVVEVISLDSKEDAEEMGFADHEIAVADLIDISSDPAGMILYVRMCNCRQK